MKKPIILETTCSRCYEWLPCVGLNDVLINKREYESMNAWLCKKCIRVTKVKNKNDILEKVGWRALPKEIILEDRVISSTLEEVFP